MAILFSIPVTYAKLSSTRRTNNALLLSTSSLCKFCERMVPVASTEVNNMIPPVTFDFNHHSALKIFDDHEARSRHLLRHAVMPKLHGEPPPLLLPRRKQPHST